MNKTNQKSDASMRVFLTLLYLIKNPASIDEIIDFLNDNEAPNKIYTTEVILKYLNTLKAFGIKIVREKDKYIVLNYPPYYEFTLKEISGLKIFNSIKLFNSKDEVLRQEFMFKLERKLTENTKQILHSLNISQYTNSYYEQNIELINTIKDYIKREQLIILDTYDGCNYIAKPVELNYIKDKIMFTIYLENKSKYIDIDIDDIKSVKLSSLKSKNVNINPSIVFKLKGTLTQNYSDRNDETVLKGEDNNYITVINRNESENSLMKRLLRYAEFCEIIKPMDARTTMKNLIEKIYNLYQDDNGEDTSLGDVSDDNSEKLIDL